MKGEKTGEMNNCKLLHQCLSPLKIWIDLLQLLEEDLHLLPVGRALCDKMKTLYPTCISALLSPHLIRISHDL